MVQRDHGPTLFPNVCGLVTSDSCFPLPIAFPLSSRYRCGFPRKNPCRFRLSRGRCAAVTLYPRSISLSFFVLVRCAAVRMTIASPSGSWQRVLASGRPCHTSSELSPFAFRGIRALPFFDPRFWMKQRRSGGLLRWSRSKDRPSTISSNSSSSSLGLRWSIRDR